MVAISASVVVLVLFGVPALVLAVWLVVRDALIRIDAGELGLVVVRGKPTDRTLLPGTHYVRPLGRMTIHGYPSRELSYRTTREAGSEDDARPSVDPPVGVVLGDRTHAEVCYAIRFRLDPSRLRDIHLQVGPDGVLGLVRDLSERQVADGLADDDISYHDLFGSARAELQERITRRVATAFEQCGLLLTFFALREVDLGETGQAVQAKARATALAEQERVFAESRRMRARHDMDVAQILQGIPETALRYQQIEAWRTLAERWDGHIGVPTPASARPAPPAPADEVTP